MNKGAKAAQLADQIRDHLAAWIRKDFPGCLVSVTQVQLSMNLQQATVWLECFDEASKKYVPKIQQRQGEYQRELYRHMRRFALPTIHFALSSAFEDQERIEQLLKSEEI